MCFVSVLELGSQVCRSLEPDINCYRLQVWYLCPFPTLLYLPRIVVPGGWGGGGEGWHKRKIGGKSWPVRIIPKGELLAYGDGDHTPFTLPSISAFMMFANTVVRGATLKHPINTTLSLVVYRGFVCIRIHCRQKYETKIKR